MLCEPWLPARARKPWRLMVPWKPRPLLVALVHPVAHLEDVHSDRLADLARNAAQLLQVPARGRVEPGEGAGVRLRHPARLGRPEADLDGFVAVGVGCGPP